MHAHLTRTIPEKPKRLIVTAWGTPKTGKSHFALTFPEPLCYLNLDRSVEDIQYKFKGKDVWRGDFIIPKGLDPQACTDLLNLMDEVVDASLPDLNEAGGTLVIDTATWLWQIVQKVFLQPHKEKKAGKNGDPDEVRVMPFQYADANLWMSSLMRRVIPYENVNAVFLHSAHELYNSQGQPSGVLGCHGWKAVHGVSQFTVRLTRRDQRFWALYEVCRLDPSLEGLEMPDPDFELFGETFLT